NSLPHVLEPGGLAAALADFRACLRPGGLLLIQNRNFDQVLAQRQRWMGPEAHRAGEREWLFVRFYDFEPDGLITFNVLRLSRTGDGAWQQQPGSTRLWPQRRDDLLPHLAQAGFSEIRLYGSLSGEPFDPTSSPNLALVARRS
ncbi:MAG: hypothetical protein ACKOC5_06835, partial [Chloroflexota bacterium]